MKRLYIGGLGHTVSEKDLKDRFGKFGDVSDVEIISRKDEQGSPLKTFGYISINITDAEYKRCLGVLNKSTWKGGTLNIQLAKESFLHKLAEEREQLVEVTKTPRIIPQEKLVDSLKAAGVENFHMKAAVPGTEIPEHKDWVVSKFGRVLPVLNLKCKGKKKIFRYDPSKHCHNIKRLETVDDVTSVSKLTWELEGGDDEISKKRRGEFPKQKPCPKRSKVDLSSFLSNLAQSNKINAAESENKNKMVIQQNGLSATKTGIQRPVVKRPVCVLNDGDSEDEIRMLVAQEHSRDPKQTSAEDGDDNLEVVGDDFIVKSTALWSGMEQDGVKSQLTTSKDDEDYDSADTDEILTQRKTQKTQLKDSPTKSSKNESSPSSQLAKHAELISDYKSKEEIKTSSAPRKRKDNNPEIITQRKTQKTQLKDSPTKSSKNESSPSSQLAKRVISDNKSVEEPKKEIKTSSAPQKRKGNNPEDILASLFKNFIPDKENKVNTLSLPAFVGTKDLFEGPEPILRSVTQSKSPKRLKRDLNLEERTVPEDASQTPSSTRPSQQKLSDLKKLSTSKKLLNQSSEDESESNEECDKSAQDVTFTTSSATQSVKTIPETKPKTVSSNSNTPIKPKKTKISRSSSSDSESSEEEDNVEVFTTKTTSATQSLGTNPKTKLKTVSSNSNTPIKPKKTKISRSSSSDSESSEEEDNEDSAEVFTTKTSSVTQSIRTNPKTELKTVSSNSNTPIKPKHTKVSRSSSSDSSSEESETSDDEEKSGLQPKDSKPADSKKVESHPTVLQSTFIDAQKYQKDNQKRLAALEQRQKETEQQRKLIQGALSSVDTLKANKGKHIVFDSDEEDKTTNEAEEQPKSQKKTLFEDDSEADDQQTSTSREKENKKPGGNKLFDSEDEDDDAEDDVFQIKPQFEGKAGQKLMKLQARFGTDSRFQIDSRFLESDDEAEDQDAAAPEKDAEQLLEEKKRSLDILQSVVKTSIQPLNTKKSKTFKDVSSLHYDPTLEEHAAFESKKEQPKKESKAARRKKREEAEKLPEVSKDIYFEVSTDLKEVFGTSKENQDEKEMVSWDKEAEETEDIMAPMDVSNAEVHEDASGGFKFSFFGEHVAVDTTAKKDEYKIEMIKGAKFSWQVDPRFQDSSSDEEGVDEVEEDQTASSKIKEEPTPSQKFFFFYQGDERLKEGPGMFYRIGNLGDQREAWEEKRTSLREECRKKHRDAKRRERPSLKISAV